jgi:hypothetical protein
MDKPGFGCLWVLVALLAWRASAACTSYGVDYSSGGAYYIDGESDEYFSFVSVFRGKRYQRGLPLTWLREETKC